MRREFQSELFDGLHNYEIEDSLITINYQKNNPMKFTLQVACFLILLFTFALSPISISGQKRNASSSSNQSVKRKISTPKLVPPPVREFNHPYKINVNYDRFKNLTTISLLIRVTESWTPELYFTFSYAGQTLKYAPSNIKFTVTTSRGSGNRMPTTDFVILTDINRIRGKMAKEVSFIAVNGGITLVTNTASLNYATFLSLANAQEIEMQVGDEEFSLTEEQLEAVRDFASRTATNPQQAKTEKVEGLALLDNLFNSLTKEEIIADAKKLPNYGTQDSESLRRAILALPKTISVFKTSTNPKELSDVNEAIAVLIDEALEVIPDKTLLKSLLVSCNHLLGDSYVLRAYDVGVRDNFSNAADVERISNNYKITKFSSEDRVNEILRRAEIEAKAILDIAREAKIINEN